MNSSRLIPETNNNNLICEAVGCSAKATSKVMARLGSEGAISLFLCENCKPRFSFTASEQQDIEIGCNTNSYQQDNG